MSSLKISLLIIISLFTSYIGFIYLKVLSLFCVIATPFILYLLFKMRYNLMFIPFYLIAKIQKRNFKMATSFKDIKATLALNDKGRGLEELFSTEAWKPILSLESVNDPIWTVLRNNFMTLKDELPPKERLAEIAAEEANYLVSNKILIDSRQISISTVKIFLSWIFDQESKEFLTETLLQKLFEASLEYRKEIAVKGKGCMIKKREAVDLVINIIKQSKYKNLLNWTDQTCYSVVMQPFVISPMINMSDIAVSIKKYSNKMESITKFSDFIDYCIYVEHPFPVLERYDESTNTQIYIDLTNLKNNKEFDCKLLNFGMGFRSCLGRLYAKEFLNSFFDPISKIDTFKPEINHLYSGRDNDNINLQEGLYSIGVLFNILKSEFIKTYLD